MWQLSDQQVAALWRREAELNSSAEMLSHDLSGPLAVGCVIPMSPWLLRRIIEHFFRQYPKVTLEISESTPSNLHRQLLNGLLDGAILFRHQIHDDGLAAEHIGKAVPMVLLSSRHPLAERTGISLRQLADEPCIMPAIAPTADAFEHILHLNGFQPRVLWRSTNVETIRSVVARGVAYSLLVTQPRTSLTYEGNEIVYIPIIDDIPEAEIVIAHLRSVTPTAKLRELIRLARMA